MLSFLLSQHILHLLTIAFQIYLIFLDWIVDILVWRLADAYQALPVVYWRQEAWSVLADCLVSRNLCSCYLVASAIVWFIAHFSWTVFIKIGRPTKDLVKVSWVSVTHLLLESLVPRVLFSERGSWRVVSVEGQSSCIWVLEQTIILVLDKVFKAHDVLAMRTGNSRNMVIQEIKRLQFLPLLILIRLSRGHRNLFSFQGVDTRRSLV